MQVAKKKQEYMNERINDIANELLHGKLSELQEVTTCIKKVK